MGWIKTTTYFSALMNYQYLDVGKFPLSLTFFGSVPLKPDGSVVIRTIGPFQEIFVADGSEHKYEFMASEHFRSLHKAYMLRHGEPL